MRKFTFGWVLSVAVLLPTIGTAQVFVRPNPYPPVTAATAAWQRSGDPVFHAGAFYYPTGPTVFFDGNVMVRTGTYQGVPLYEDATLSRSPSSTSRSAATSSGRTNAGATATWPARSAAARRRFRCRRDGDEFVGVRVPVPVEPGDPRAGRSRSRAERHAAEDVMLVPAPRASVASDQRSRFRLSLRQPYRAAAATAARQHAADSCKCGCEFDGARWYSSGPAVPYLGRTASCKSANTVDSRSIAHERAAQDEIYIAVVAGRAGGAVQEEQIDCRL